MIPYFGVRPYSTIDHKSLGRNFQVRYYADYIYSEVLNWKNQNFKNELSKKDAPECVYMFHFLYFTKKIYFLTPKMQITVILTLF